MNAFSTAVEFLRLLSPMPSMAAEAADAAQRTTEDEYPLVSRKVHIANDKLRKYLRMGEATDDHPLSAMSKVLKVSIVDLFDVTRMQWVGFYGQKSFVTTPILMTSAFELNEWSQQWRGFS